MSYMAQQQQRQLQQQHQPSYPQPPTGIPRMPSSHPQPILPKPASGDMFGSSASMRYSSSNVGDNLPGPDFPSSRMTDQQQHGIPSASQSYGNTPMGRMGSSSEMLAKYGSSQGAYQRNNPQSFPVSLHSRHTPSPNITLGSPMRVVADGKYQVLIEHLHSPHCPLYISYGTDEILIGNQELLKFVVQSASPRLDILNNNNKQPFKSGHVE